MSLCVVLIFLMWTLSLPLQSCVSVFKALSTLEKTVDRCSFYLDSQHAKLVFVFHCRHGKDSACPVSSNTALYIMGILRGSVFVDGKSSNIS